jgi:thiamine biosynthesis lipoprotein
MIPIDLPPGPTADAFELAALAPRLWRFHDDYVLGTRLQLLVNTPSALLAHEAARAARLQIERLNRVFNDRLASSEISELNRIRAAAVGSDMFAVLQLAETWRAITCGAFNGHMGELLSAWRRSVPEQNEVERALASMRAAHVHLDVVQQRVDLSGTGQLSLDAIAKGYIVDAALNAARRAAPGVSGIALEIGGDIRCWGSSPDCRGWRIGIADAKRPADNAPLVDAILIRNGAIATSGRGPRDCIAGGYRSTTLSPFTGRPVADVISATVVASHAADADAIATACLVLPIEQSLSLVNRLATPAARITDTQGRVHESASWPQLRLAATTPEKSAGTVESKPAKPAKPNASPENAPALPPALRWPNDWEIGIKYIAPERKESERSTDFRSPYMALWITDDQNRPVHTTIMVGQDPKWQRDNFIWWNSYRDRAKQVIDLVSQATALSGRYRIFWGGLNDSWQRVPVGKYILHLETSQERGKHHYRSVPLEIGRDRFKKQLENLPESGGLEITYGHYNDRFEADE